MKIKRTSKVSDRRQPKAGDCSLHRIDRLNLDFSLVSQEILQWQRQGLSVKSLLAAERRQKKDKRLGKRHSPSPESSQAQAEQFSRMGLTLETLKDNSYGE